MSSPEDTAETAAKSISCIAHIDLHMRIIFYTAFFAASLLSGVPIAHASASDCQTLDDCIANLHALAETPGKYNSTLIPDEIALNKHLLSFDGAVPRLVSLLADPDANVANIAAAALRDATYIDPIYLPQIRAGLDRHLGWLAPALGRMPSDEAAREAVARLLVSESAPENQEAYAVELSGRRAIPFIVEAARCRKGCGPEDQYVLSKVLGRIKADRSQAAPGFIAIAQDPSVPFSVARGALEMIGVLREEGRSVEPSWWRYAITRRNWLSRSTMRSSACARPAQEISSLDDCVPVPTRSCCAILQRPAPQAVQQGRNSYVYWRVPIGMFASPRLEPWAT